MSFSFSLATLLRIREITEQREERLLGQILNQIASGRETLATLEAQRRSLRAQREMALQQSTSAFAIVGFDRQMHHIEDLEAAGKEHLAKLNTLREQQMKVYEAAHRNTELLAGMGTTQLAAYQRERARQEQHAMDDRFSSRRTRS